MVQDDRRPNRYLIPDGFVGWVRIDYEVEGAPELPVKDGFRVYRIPQNGLLETSSAVETGWASDEYYYVDSAGNWQQLPATARGREGMIWARGFSLPMAYELSDDVSRAYSTGVRHEHFFVGPEELSRRLPGRDEDGRRLYGSIPQSEPSEVPYD